MKKLLLFVGASFLFMGLRAQVPVTAIDIDKLVSISNTAYDMGKISSGKPLEYNVTIKNISKDTVTLQTVRGQCGCTTPKFKAAEKLPPGGSTFIMVGFNGGATGEFTKFVDIVFNEGITKQIRFFGNAVADSAHTGIPVQR